MDSFSSYLLSYCICFVFIYADQLEHARVHPKFLHSNATSHKWAFGGELSSQCRRHAFVFLYWVAMYHKLLFFSSSFDEVTTLHTLFQEPPIYL